MLSAAFLPPVQPSSARLATMRCCGLHATTRGGRDMTHQLTGQTSQLPARVHPDDRGRIEGLNALATLIQGAPQPKASLSYYTPILIQCTLPHSDPKALTWAKTNGDFTLVLTSG